MQKNVALHKSFQTSILRWFEQHGRKDLPWQQNKTPYSIWVSEIMLQQTQVKTVIPYYERFMRQFPSVFTLANAPIDTVLNHWSGLGYYARVRNLHKTAQIIVSEYGGTFPDTLNTLTALPGIGRSTAGAVLSFGFQKPYPILDGNIKRVLTRVKGITDWLETPRATAQLWQLAETLTPPAHTAAYNQAMMDMGALVCTTKNPNCPACPVQLHCYAYQNHLQDQIPAHSPRKNGPSQRVLFLIIEHQNKILLEKRPAKGIWGGLWSFPQIDVPPRADGILQKHLQALETQLQLKVASYQAWPLFLHHFTHRTLEIIPVQIRVKGKKCPSSLVRNGTGEEASKRLKSWFTPQETASLGLPAPCLKLIRQLQSRNYPLTNPG